MLKKCQLLIFLDYFNQFVAWPMKPGRLVIKKNYYDLKGKDIDIYFFFF